MTVQNDQRRAAVYRLWDADGNLLYIGSSYAPEKRCEAHRRKPWWPEVARRTEEWFPHRGRAYVEEMKAIAVERSKYNAMGTPEYTTPQTEAVRQRNALAGVRGKLVGAAGSVSDDIRMAARAAGYSAGAAHRMAKLAEIEFLEWTGLFAAAVKWRRAELEWLKAQDG